MSIPDIDRSADVLEHEKAIGLCTRNGFRYLRFTPELEEFFYTDTVIPRAKWMFRFSLLAAMIFALFAITDAQIVPDIYLTAWKWRLGVAEPVCLILAGLLLHPLARRRIDLIAGTINVIGSATIAVIFAMSDHQNVLHFHTGILPIVMYANIVLRLRFRYACAVSIITFIIYILMISHIEAMTAELAVHHLSVMLIGIGISLMAAYQMEYDVRSNYLRQLGDEIRAIRLRQARDEMEKISVSDALTGLANRRHFDSCIEAEWQAALVSGASLSLIFIDVDDFKAYNDHFGHQGGDDCLRKVAGLAKAALIRSQDLCARYGGEEFVVLLTNTPLEVACDIAERIRSRIDDEKLPHPKARAAVWVTASLGVACVRPVPGLRKDDLVEQADKALYIAKSNGRNRVEAFGAG